MLKLLTIICKNGTWLLLKMYETLEYF